MGELDVGQDVRAALGQGNHVIERRAHRVRPHESSLNRAAADATQPAVALEDLAVDDPPNLSARLEGSPAVVVVSPAIVPLWIRLAAVGSRLAVPQRLSMPL